MKRLESNQETALKGRYFLLYKELLLEPNIPLKMSDLCPPAPSTVNCKSQKIVIPDLWSKFCNLMYWDRGINKQYNYFWTLLDFEHGSRCAFALNFWLADKKPRHQVSFPGQHIFILFPSSPATTDLYRRHQPAVPVLAKGVNSHTFRK